MFYQQTVGVQLPWGSLTSIMDKVEKLYSQMRCSRRRGLVAEEVESQTRSNRRQWNIVKLDFTNWNRTLIMDMALTANARYELLAVARISTASPGTILAPHMRLMVVGRPKRPVFQDFFMKSMGVIFFALEERVVNLGVHPIVLHLALPSHTSTAQASTRTTYECSTRSAGSTSDTSSTIMTGIGRTQSMWDIHMQFPPRREFGMQFPTTTAVLLIL
jgi:hypothetical protein